MFADGTNLFYTNKNICLKESTRNNTLLIYEWFIANQLSPNAEKIRYSFFINKALFIISHSRSVDVTHYKFQ